MKATKTALRAAHSQPQPPMTDDAAFEYLCFCLGDWNVVQASIDQRREWMTSGMECNRYDAFGSDVSRYAGACGELDAMCDLYGWVYEELREDAPIQRIVEKVLRRATREVMSFASYRRWDTTNEQDRAFKGAQAEYYAKVADHLPEILSELARRDAQAA